MENNQPVNEKHITEGPFIHDDGAFTVFKNRFGLWNSADSEGKRMVCGADREAVEFFSREKLAGYPNCYTTVTGAKFGKDML